MNTLRTEDEIIANWIGDIGKPVVSICCITYNHEPYIQQALEGFLIQDTKFPFEVLIHDDASTDQTAKIIQEYTRKYPRILKPIYQTENQYTKGIKPNATFNFPRSKGKYIALCEGDDYWLDKGKIEKQVTYLEKHTGVSISGHLADVISSFNNKAEHSRIPHNSQQCDFSSRDVLLGKARLPTLTVMFRNCEYIHECRERSNVINGDLFLISICGRLGGSHFHHDILPSIYREHLQGVWSPLTEKERNLEEINVRYWMYKYYRRERLNDVADLYLSEDFSIGAKQMRVSNLLIIVLAAFLPQRIKHLIKGIRQLAGRPKILSA